MSVDEIRRLPPSTGLLAYRNRRSVLLDLAGWDERPDAPHHPIRKTRNRAGAAQTSSTTRTAQHPPVTPEPAEASGAGAEAVREE